MSYQPPQFVAPLTKPDQYEQSEGAFLIEVDLFVRATPARTNFNVSGKGLAAAVIDTGLNTTHVDFASRVPVQRNFTADNGANPGDATDGQGHGTNVAGIIAANGIHFGMAPDASIIPLKALPNVTPGSFQAIANALEWVIQNRTTHNITVVCMSLQDGRNYLTDDFSQDQAHTAIRDDIRTLRDASVPVVIAAGNQYYTWKSQQGMSYPAILRECVSVGAVYDSDMDKAFSYRSGAIATSAKAGQITPFSQRLHPSVNPDTYTDIFAPGAPVTSSGILNNESESTMDGTSQAAPVTAGIILLMQELHLRATGELPAVDTLVGWLRDSGVPIHDGDDESDNVNHTDLDFIRIDAVNALEAVQKGLQAHGLKSPST
jgi:subtilisin family serine protease